MSSTVTSSSICRVVGLTSDVGKKRNGSAARANLRQKTGNGDDDGRHPVCVDGFPGPMSIKSNNIEIFPPNSRTFSVGIGRQTILDNECNAALVDNDVGQPIARSCITGGAARSRGSLEAMKKFVQIHDQQPGSMMIKLTDLNMARALNRVAFGDDDVCVAEPSNAIFQKIAKRFPKVNGDRNILVKFESPRISEDQLETKKLEMYGPQRYDAVKHGSYQIYPCALRKCLDAHEVRYADVSGKHKVTALRHETYLDYGVEEAIMYAKHTVALEESDRLHPAVLATVDPQAFWSAMLWFDAFVQTLQELKLSVDLIDAWKELEKGRCSSKKYFADASKMFDFGSALTKGPEENWGVTKSKDLHVRIATDFAICAFEAIHLAIHENGVDSGGIKVLTLDTYKGHELDNYLKGKANFYKLMMEEEEKKGKDMPDTERSTRLYNRAMRSVGFGRESNICLPDAERTCDNCGKRSKTKLLTCSRW